MSTGEKVPLVLGPGFDRGGLRNWKSSLDQTSQDVTLGTRCFFQGEVAEFLAKLRMFGGFRSTKLQFYPLRPTCIIFSEPYHLVPDNEQIGIA